MSDERPTAAGAYQKIKAHEDLCALRYEQINSSLGELKSAAKQHERAAWTMAVAVIAWALVQLYNDHVKPAAAPPLPAAVSAK